MLWFTTGCQPSLDAALAHADRESDPARRQAIGVQLADGGVTLGANSPALAPQLIDARTAHWHLVPPWLLGLGPLDAGHGRDGTAMPIDRGAKRTTKVMQEMPSVGRLLGPGRTLANGLGEDRGAVARDDCYVGMLL